MANPQPEPFVQFSKELYRAILLAPFSATQQSIVLAVVLKTYGDYRRKSAPISVGLLARITGDNKGHISRSLATLIKECVIMRLSPGCDNHTPQRLALNKDYERWGRFSVAADSVLASATVDDEQPLPTGNGTVATEQPSDGLEEDATVAPRQRNGCCDAMEPLLPGNGTVAPTQPLKTYTETREEKNSLSETADAASDAKPKPPTLSAKSPEQWQADYSDLLSRCHYPSDVQQLADLMAAANKSGKVALSRVVRELVGPILEMQADFDDRALRHGLRAAIRARAPNANYVRKAAAGYVSGPQRLGRRDLTEEDLFTMAELAEAQDVPDSDCEVMP